MKLVRIAGGSRGTYIVLAVGVAVTGTIGLMGCLPQQISSVGNSAPTVIIKAPTLDVNVRAGELVTVNYEVSDPDGDATSLTISYDLDAQEDTNDEVLIATGLPLGSKAYQINTATIPSGRYWIQLDAEDDHGGRTVRYAQGAMNVSGVATFAFQEPLADVRVTRQDDITIRFTSSETVNYTLFYDKDPNLLGDEADIISGSGKNVTQPWNLDTVFPGTYFVGAKIRDSFGGVETYYAPGRVIIDAPPDLVVKRPNLNIEVYAGQTVDVEYEGTYDQSGQKVIDPDGEARMTVFVDVDRVPGNGNEITIESGIAEQPGLNAYSLDTTGIPTEPNNPKTYFIGVSATDNLNDEVTAYAPGRVKIFDPNLSIEFIEPETDVSVALGNSIVVSWQVFAPVSGGTLSVRYVRLDGAGDPVGEEMLIAEGPIAPDATTFDTNVLDVQAGTFYRLLIRAVPTLGGPIGPIFGPKVHVKATPDIVLKEPQTSQTLGTGDRLYIEWAVTNLVGPPTQVTAEMFLDPDTTPESGGEIALTPVDRRIDTVNNIYTYSTTLDLNQTSVPLGDYYLYLKVNDGGNVIADYGSAAADVGDMFANAVAGQTIIITIKPRITGTFWMGDAGKDSNADGVPESIVFIGFDFYDSAGSFVGPLGDFDGDGLRDFLIVAQYAKPFRDASVGDAYVIYGDRQRYAAPLAISNVSVDPNIAVLGLNSVGTTIRGALFIGPSQVSTPDASSTGIQSAMFMPDLTGDGVGELAFGIPYLHNSFSLDASTAAGFSLTQIVRPGQLRRGGVIVATSDNPLNQDSQLPLEEIIRLDHIGQIYSPSVLQDPAARERRVTDLLPGDPNSPDVHHIELTEPDGLPLPPSWGHPFGPDPGDNDIAGPRPVPPLNREPLNFNDDGTNRYVWDAEFNPLLVDGNNDGDFLDGIPDDRCRYTGFLVGEQSNHFGSRILGDKQNDLFGTSIEWWRGALVATSPLADFGGRTGAGVVYVRNLQNRVTGAVDTPWTGPVKPNNLVIASPSAFGHPTLGATGIIYGAQANANLSTVASLGSPARLIDPTTRRGGDFNGDGLEDLALGAPGTNGGNGAAYVFYVRMPEPYEFDLAQLNPPDTDPSRRAGVQINGGSGDRLGEVKPSGLDFNGDGFADALFGNPKANSGKGQVILVFGGPTVASASGGWSIDDVAFGPRLSAGTADPNRALGIVFEGVSAGDGAGSAVAGIGDFDGDGLDDLVIAAPNATPRFESGGVFLQGIDRDGDGNPDDVDGDGSPDPLLNAGVVYLIYGQRDLNRIRPYTDPPVVNLRKVGTPDVPGATFVGRQSGDGLGGGFTTPDGITNSTRAIGFAPAGDVDGDGLDDILISSVRASPLGHKHAGEVYLIFGVQPPSK